MNDIQIISIALFIMSLIALIRLAYELYMKIKYPGLVRVMTREQFDTSDSLFLGDRYEKLKKGKIRILEEMPEDEAEVYYQFLSDSTSKYMRNKIVKPGLFFDIVIKDEFYLKD